MTSKVYKSAQGKSVDMGRLQLQNEGVRAVGNMKVNARGDELGPGGRIIKKREEVLREASATSTPSQLNVRQKNVVDMDPEGNE